MSNEIEMLKKDQIGDVFKEIEDAYMDIPFENSRFQNLTFLVKGEYTPERAYRHIGLRMHSKIRALKETVAGREKEDLEIEKLKYKIDTKLPKKLNESNDEYQYRFDLHEIKKKEWKVEIKQKEDARTFTDKLVNDALYEVSTLYTVFKKMPKYTRDEFEGGELKHFEIKLARQIKGIAGAADSLANMGMLPTPEQPVNLQIESDARLTEEMNTLLNKYSDKQLEDSGVLGK